MWAPRTAEGSPRQASSRRKWDTPPGDPQQQEWSPAPASACRTPASAEDARAACLIRVARLTCGRPAASPRATPPVSLPSTSHGRWQSHTPETEVSRFHRQSGQPPALGQRPGGPPNTPLLLTSTSHLPASEQSKNQRAHASPPAAASLGPAPGPSFRGRAPTCRPDCRPRGPAAPVGAWRRLLAGGPGE